MDRTSRLARLVRSSAIETDSITGYVGSTTKFTYEFTAARPAEPAFVSATSSRVHLGPFPLWSTRIPAEQIGVVVVEPITPIGREWGNRGSLRRHGEIFLDAGHSTTCLAFHLTDDRVIRIDVESPERGRDIAAAVEATLGR